MRRLLRTVALVVAGAAASTTVAHAQSKTPEFSYGKAEDAKVEEEGKDVVYKASAQAGFILTTGNSETVTLSGSAKASRKAGNNRLALEANGAFARSTIFVVEDDNGDGVLQEDEIDQIDQTTTQAWEFRARYDRFFGGEKNSGYVLGSIGANEPAGKELIGRGQVGYSRQLYKDDKHEIVGEGGYDFTYEDLIDEDGISIHSARLFAGYTGKLSDDTSFESQLEALLNLNSVETSVQDAGPLEDTRLNARAALKTKLFEDISFQASFTLLYDAAPAPRNYSIPFADGVSDQADAVDTVTDMSIIVNFL